MTANLAWLREFRKPVTLVSLAISAISLIFAILSLPRTQAPRKISYFIKTRQLLEYPGGSSGVGMFDSTGRPIDGDAFVAQVSIWNSGSLAILQSDAYRPLKYELFDRGRIVSVEKIAELEPAVTNMRTTLDAKSVTFQWDTLDLGMGASYRVVYISLDRTNRLKFPKILSQVVLNGPYSTDVTGFIKEGQLTDVNSSPMSMMRVSLVLVFISMIPVFALQVTNRIRKKTDSPETAGSFQRMKTYFAVPLILGFVMSLMALGYAIFLLGVPKGLTGLF